jgi:hypothetical protein
MKPRQKSLDSKINLTISLVFHTFLIGAIFFFAAREGMLGKKLKEITVTLAPKEKKPEPVKEKPPEQKVPEQKLAEKPKPADIPAPKSTPLQAPPPQTAAVAPAAAPELASLPAFEFHDGAQDVTTISDPNAIYKALVEHQIRSRWNRPEDLADDNFVAEIELTIDKKGEIEDTRWVSGSGNKRWDESVKASLNGVKTINRPPPKDFPARFIVRYDVEVLKTETVSMQ